MKIIKTKSFVEQSLTTNHSEILHFMYEWENAQRNSKHWQIRQINKITGHDITWPSWRIKLPETRLFVQPVIQASNKRNIQIHQLKLVSIIHQCSMDFPHKDQQYVFFFILWRNRESDLGHVWNTMICCLEWHVIRCYCMFAKNLFHSVREIY